MTSRILGAGAALLVAIACAITVTAQGQRAVQGQKPAAGQAAVPTFSKDVAPILYKNCVMCHRPGEIAPMSLLTYDDAKPYRAEIKDEVAKGHMPPWHANAPAGTFTNERGLSAKDKDTIVRWADGGAPQGNPADMPPQPTFTEGWQLGQPDVILEMEQAYAVPASGEIPYEYFYLPTNFKEAKWIKSIEVRPGVREAVHHVLVNYRAEPDMTRTPVLRPNAEQMRDPGIAPSGNAPRRPRGSARESSRLVGTYAPGTMPQVMPEGTALRLEAGGVIELQMHYTAFGTAAKDRTRVGIIFAKEPAREVRPSHFFNTTLELPAGAKDVRVDADISFVAPATIWGIFPHTHLRGTKWLYTLELPDGTKKTVLDVPNYDFHWQTYYMFKQPLEVPAGAKLVSSAWYDNSASNPANPNPKVTVKWGDQTWEEMQYTGLMFSPALKPALPSLPAIAPIKPNRR